MSDPAPTNPQAGTEHGRIARWPDPEDLRWLAEHCCCAEDAPHEATDRCLRLRFRASTALHMSGRNG